MWHIILGPTCDLEEWFKVNDYQFARVVQVDFGNLKESES